MGNRLVILLNASPSSGPIIRFPFSNAGTVMFVYFSEENLFWMSRFKRNTKKGREEKGREEKDRVG